MSAIGTKRTCARALQMSAFGGKADMMIALRNVPFDPKRTLAARPQPELTPGPVQCASLSRYDVLS
jgi:hypothetical protein